MKSSSHPALRAKWGACSFDGFGIDFHGAVGLIVEVAVRRTLQKSPLAHPLQRKNFSVLEAIDTCEHHTCCSRVGVPFLDKHNAATFRREPLPAFPFVNAILEFLHAPLEKCIAVLERCVLLHGALMFTTHLQTFPFQFHLASDPGERGKQPAEHAAKSCDQSGYQPNDRQHCSAPQYWPTTPRIGGADQLHTDFPDVEKGCVRNLDSTLRGNGDGEGGYA